MNILVCYWNGEEMKKETISITDNQPLKEKKTAGKRAEFIAQKCQEITGFNPSSFSTI